ncbi:MAG: cbb3-type cytochrome c oxidase subunit I [Acidimicrobiia bacterium]
MSEGGPLARPGVASMEPAIETTATDDELQARWADPPGLWGRLRAVQNDAIGKRLLLTGFFFLLLGGSVDSLVMRLQLARPESDLVSPQLFNELFTNHGSVTMFLVILPIFEGFAILLLPLLLGTREMPFPRLGAFAYYTFLFGGLLYYSSTLFQLVPDAGWFAYTPLSTEEFSPGLALDFWVLGLGVAEVGAIAAAGEIIIGILKMRAPGMTLSRLPLFAWAMLVTAFMILFAFTPLIVGSLLMELDRGFGTRFFDVAHGGSSLLWQHLFWIFGHPEVYIQFLPATGIVSMALPVLLRRRIVGYTWLVGAFVAIGFLSFGLWAHHMFTVGLPPLVLAFFAAASMVIGVPAGVQIFAWLATIRAGTPRWNTAFLFLVGFLVVFVIGGITGIMVAAVPFDSQAHDSYFVVGHLHYVLIGGVAFPIFAGIYYWWPKFTGRLLNERLGKLNFWLLFVGVNVAFFPMHVVGLLGMPRRVYTYPAGLGWEVWNLISTAGVFLIVPGILAFIVNIVYSRRRGPPAGANPWGGDTLEWAVASPPLDHGWSVVPIVHSRHPLWDQDDLRTADPELRRFVDAFSRWPLRWRAALVVRATDARPEEVFRVGGPSAWPLVTAVGAVMIFAAELLKLRWGAALAALVVVAGVIGWNWPQQPPMSEDEEIAFEREHGVPVHAGGSDVVAAWGMGLAILFVAIAFGAFLLAYFYLRLENEQWPPPGVAPPGGASFAVSGALAVAGAAAARAAVRRVRSGDQRGSAVALGAALAIGAAALATEAVAFSGTGFGGTDHAYGSIFFTLGGFCFAVMGTALVMTAMALVWALRGVFTARRHVTVVNTSRFWAAALVVWLIGLGTLHMGPYLT